MSRLYSIFNLIVLQLLISAHFNVKVSATDNDFEFKTLALLTRGRTTLRDFEANVGDKLNLKYSVHVKSRKTGKYVCNDVPKIIDVQVEPKANVFLNSKYSYERGEMLENTFPLENPFPFIPRSEGALTVTLTGTGCTQQHPEPWTFVNTIQVAGATVTWDSKNTVFPQDLFIFRHERLGGLAYMDKDLNPTFTFHVTNTMNRRATFGIMTIMVAGESWLVTNDNRISTSSVTNLPALESIQKEMAIVPPQSSCVLEPGDSKTLSLHAAPLMPLGTRSWRSPTRIGAYQGVGFTRSCQTFVIQDWDKKDDAEIAQTPLGQSILTWGVQAQASLRENVFEVDENMFRVQRPSPAPQQNFAPFYAGPIDNEIFRRFTYNDTTGFYYLRDDPPGLGWRTHEYFPSFSTAPTK